MSWTKISVFSVIAISALAWALYLRRPKVVVAGVTPAPAARQALKPNAPTTKFNPPYVSVQNLGLDGALVQYVEFKPTEAAFATPSRPASADRAAAIPIAFALADRNPATGIYRHVLATPQRTPGKDGWTNLKLSFVAPEHRGYTYRGALTIHFANAPEATVPTMELDIVGR